MTVIQFDVSSGEFIRSLTRYSRHKAALSAAGRLDYSANFPNCPEDLSGVGEAPLEVVSPVLDAGKKHGPQPEISTGALVDSKWRVVLPVIDRTPEDDAADLAAAREAKRTALRSKFAQERDKGVLVNGDLIATTHQARLELAALVENLTANGGSQKGVTRAGKRVVFDLATTTALLAAVDAHHAACNAREYDLDAAIEAAADKAALDAIDLTTGWPE